MFILLIFHFSNDPDPADPDPLHYPQHNNLGQKLSFVELNYPLEGYMIKLRYHRLQPNTVHVK